MEQCTKTAEELKNLADGDDAARAVLGWLSTKSNTRGDCPVDSVKKFATKWARKTFHDDTLLERSDVIQVMRDLEKLHLGRFIVGRRGAKSRFEFWSNHVEIGKAAMGQIKAINIEPGLSTDDIIKAHKELLANALGISIRSVRIKITAQLPV